MADNKKDKKPKDKQKDKFRFSIYNFHTYEELWSKNLSRINIISFFSGITIILIALVFVLVAYTPVRELIPGYPDGNMLYIIDQNTQKLDSLEYQLKVRDQYFDNIKRIIYGQVPVDTIRKEPVTDTNLYSFDDLDFERSKEDSILRLHVETEDAYSLRPTDNYITKPSGLHDIQFFPPVYGVVTGRFNAAEEHYGIDIVAAPGEVISATLNGTVTLSTWTLETGYILHIQHDDNLVSVYKHLSGKLKNQGSKVKAGEAIAIIGNSGMYSTGPHLHFELWHNGKALNPEDYIVF
ncbi:MAG: M23 family metallopeptidase [Bacteroidota bacterium]